MKAIIYDKKNKSCPLSLCEVDKPMPGQKEVLVKIVASSINAADYRSMQMGIIPKNKIYGADIAGVVEAVGIDANRFKVGERVVGDLSSCGFGGFAEFVCVSEAVLAKIPEGVDFKTAAAVPLAAVTALQGLQLKGPIKKGQRILIYGAGGGVGLFAIQLARYFEADITAVCGKGNVSVMKGLGISQVVNYNDSEAMASLQQYDLILAINGQYPIHMFKAMLKEKGTLVIIGGALSQVIKALIGGPFMSLGHKKVSTLAAKPNSKDLEQIMAWVAAGHITPIVEQYLFLDQVPEAVAYLKKGHAKGKVVIEVYDENL